MTNFDKLSAWLSQVVQILYFCWANSNYLKPKYFIILFGLKQLAKKNDICLFTCDLFVTMVSLTVD